MFKIKQTEMSFIKFPDGMQPSSIDEAFILMAYNPKSTNGKPNTITIEDIKELFTGVISEGETRFITGSDLLEFLKENTISPKPEFKGQLAAFDPLGELTGEGNFNDFQKAFTDSLTAQSIFK